MGALALVLCQREEQVHALQEEFFRSPQEVVALELLLGLACEDHNLAVYCTAVSLAVARLVCLSHYALQLRRGNLVATAV